MKFLLILSLFITTQAFADEACREESLVHFFTQGQEVNSELIGAGDACDQFGGNRVYTPKYNIYLYVNFNIPGNIDLDQIEAAVAASNHPERKSIKLALVDKNWIKRVYNDPRDAVLNWGGDTLFISEVVLEEGRLIPLMKEFYSSN
ncbi:MAG: hypothetical protein ACXWQO_06560 [Bdellovibrionota bacterium]